MEKKDFQQIMTTMKPEEQRSCEWQRMQQQIAEMRKRYGDARQFLEIFTPALQIVAAREQEKAYTGTAPLLSVVHHGYSEEIAIVWLCLQLEDINLFAGVKEKMPVGRQKELSRLILAEYGHLKTTELMLFFHRLKCGRYGRFYGTVDALFISSSLLLFMDERRKELTRIAEEKEKGKKIIPLPSTGITYAEYLALKEKEKQKGGADE